jgi:hypothetical protein
MVTACAISHEDKNNFQADRCKAIPLSGAELPVRTLIVI